MHFRFRHGVVLIGSVLFVAELLFLPGPGIQQDEALFVTPFLRRGAPLYFWHFGGVSIPVMLMDYVGALKSWLYWPIFHLWPPGVWSIRLPVCVASLVTLALFADLTRRLAGSRVAILAALFLATDAPFVLTNVFDWGPVCFLLLGTVGFLHLLHLFATSGDKKFLVAAFLVAGISVWYKAVFVFPLGAMALAFVLVCPRAVYRYLLPWNVVLAVISLGIGSAPLIVFNLRNAGSTLKASRYIGDAGATEKLLMLERTLDGRALEHYAFRSSSDEKIPLTGAPIQELVVNWYRKSNYHPGSLLLPSVLIALLALPLLSRSPIFRPLLFTWIAFGLAFGSMLVFRDAGAGPHHTVLIYPAPHFIVAATAVTLTQRFRRLYVPILAALSVLLVGSNVWLICQYYNAAQRNGYSVFWSDGTQNLVDAIRSESRPAVFLTWGIQNGVQIEAGDSIMVLDDQTPRESVLYVTHCDGYVIDESGTKQYRQLLGASKLCVDTNRAVPDSHGQPIFCLSELRVCAAQPAM